MHNSLTPARAVALGVTVLVAVALAAVGLWQLARHEWRLGDTLPLSVEFATVGGIGPGSRVRVQGVDAGVVEAVEPPSAPGEPVNVRLRLDRRFQSLVRRDATVRLAAQGVVGARVIEITPGTSTSPAVTDGDRLTGVVAPEPSEVWAEAHQLAKNLQATNEHLQSVTQRVAGLVEKVEQGEGTLGKLATSDEAHREAVELLAEARRLTTNLDSSIGALRRAWPVKGYFQRQGLGDAVDLLYRPDARQEKKQLAADQLFESGTAILSTAGRGELDGVATWLNEHKSAASEVVVAAFDQQEPTASKSQRLTQQQADAVKTYLIAQHGVQKLGWFSNRTVTAAGFGNSQPPDQAADAPPQRVEIVVFLTPVE